MDPRELQEIDRFLTLVGAGTLFEYFNVALSADSAGAILAIRDKRAWAQSRQANPKYRDEALWVIRNVALAKKALVDQRAAYITHIQGQTLAQNVGVFNTFAQGAAAAGLSGEPLYRAVAAKGKELGIPESVVRRKVQELKFVEDPTEGFDPRAAREEDEPKPARHRIPPPALHADSPAVVLFEDEGDDATGDSVIVDIEDDEDSDADAVVDLGPRAAPSPARSAPPNRPAPATPPGQARAPQSASRATQATPSKTASSDSRFSSWGADPRDELRKTIRGFHIAGALNASTRGIIARQADKMGVSSGELEALIREVTES